MDASTGSSMLGCRSKRYNVCSSAFVKSKFILYASGVVHKFSTVRRLLFLEMHEAALFKLRLSFSYRLYSPGTSHEPCSVSLAPLVLYMLDTERISLF